MELKTFDLTLKHCSLFLPDLVPSSHDVVAQAALVELMERRRQSPSISGGGGGGGSAATGGGGGGGGMGSNPADRTTMVIHARKTTRVSEKKGYTFPLI